MRGKKAKAIRRYVYGSDRKKRQERMRRKRKYVADEHKLPFYSPLSEGGIEWRVVSQTIYCADEYRRRYLDIKRILKAGDVFGDIPKEDISESSGN
jgi:hypothetical protein